MSKVSPKRFIGQNKTKKPTKKGETKYNLFLIQFVYEKKKKKIQFLFLFHHTDCFLQEMVAFTISVIGSRYWCFLKDLLTVKYQLRDWLPISVNSICPLDNSPWFNIAQSHLLTLLQLKCWNIKIFQHNHFTIYKTTIPPNRVCLQSKLMPKNGMEHFHTT